MIMQRITNKSVGRPAAPRSRVMPQAVSGNKPQILVSSGTGKMGKSVSEAVLRAGAELVPYTMCAPVSGQTHIEIGGVQLQMLGDLAERKAIVPELKKRYPNLICVDYTQPDCIHEMVDFYVDNKLPFVMGTTGGDRDAIAKQVEESGNYAVIAPNMGAFSGYSLRVVESHQSSKKDTSGTAKAIVASFQGLGIDFNVDQIQLVREKSEQMSIMKVPEDAIPGHAFHTYQLVSPDGTVTFEFQHNVVGRTTYAEGTVDACFFLQRQINEAAPKTLYNMIDVLKAGAMRA
eukprot:gene22260-29330_t